MPEIFRTRDVVVLFRGDAYTVNLDPAMVAGGWAGGQGVQWTASTQDEFIVTYSSGLYGGFMLWGSNESSDQFIAYYQQQVRYGYGVMCAGGWLISTSTYERYTYASRLAGPLVPIVYSVGTRLVFSLRGFWTIEDEWTLSGDPRGANTFYTAYVVETPSSSNDFYITLQTSI